MKKTLHFFLTAFTVFIFFSNASAQNEVYWRESFSLAATVTSDPGVNSVPYTYTGDAGVWTMYGTWTTTGTDCPAAGQLTGTNRHIRATNAVIGAGTPGTTEDDTAYAITPAVQFGIQEVHLYRSRNNRRITIWKTSDVDPTTTNWILASIIPKSTATATCTDTAIIINDGNAKRVRLRFEAGQNVDIDSVFLTSVSKILPVKFSGINAIETGGKIKVSWNVATEVNTARYVIERSSDGAAFTEVASLNATQSSSYTWVDNSPLGGNNLYRVRAVDKDGSSLYTNIVKIGLGKKLSELVIAPNPVHSGLLNLQLNNFTPGDYSVSLFNSQGQQVYNKTINHSGGSATQSLQLPSTIKAGMYSLRVVNGAEKINKNVVIE